MGDFENLFYRFITIKEFNCLALADETIQFAHCSFALFSSGKGIVQRGTKTLEVKTGDGLFLSPNETIEISCVDTLHLYILEFDTISRAEQVEKGISKARIVKVNYLATVVSLCEQLTKIQSEIRYPSTYFKEQSLFFELMYRIVSEGETEANIMTKTLQVTIDYMEANYMNDIKVNELPAMAGLTPSSYCRSIKKRTGYSPSLLLANIRVKHAKERLEKQSTSLKDIAQSVGFQDELYFSRVFKKIEGVSPTIYKKRNQKRIAVVSHLFLQDHLLALGIIPVAAPSFPSYYQTVSGFPTYLHQQLKGTAPLNLERELILEDVIKTEPNMIIHMNLQHHQKRVIQWNQADSDHVFLDWFSSWTDYQTKIAKLVNKENEAEAIMTKMDTLEKQAKDSLKDVTRKGTWAVIRIIAGDVRLYGIDGHALTELFYHKLGFLPANGLSHQSYISHALEQLVMINPDRILIIWSSQQDVNMVKKQPLWQQIKAVKEQQVYWPKSEEWDPWGPIGRNKCISEFVDYFKETMVSM
ncbi:helix-turn-helix domain-containing protein [Alkalihalobacterium bogoriense]|uniref:helix-turn-helix domain-containing protein n=1 Tax=Alkalihalobacterium bogoriense TaxID=246272 RepID=UPI0006857BF1|nr:helix-turn-helix domain-containing protein [Alkalihalobacterium bogoriense]